MSDLTIPWSPRILMAGRTFRLPVQSTECVSIACEGLDRIADRWSERDGAAYFYLRAPETPGTFEVVAESGSDSARASIEVLDLDGLRRPREFNGASWPRRWPVAGSFTSTKARQTLQDEPIPDGFDETLVSWWTSQSDDVLWHQLPGGEIPKAHFANCHQGCPSCGTAIFRYSGFYPWRRNHLPCNFKSECPSCGSVYPSNDIAVGDFTSGEFPDDGYGYFDADGNIFLFAATYHRDQCRSFGAAIHALTVQLRIGGFKEEVARQLSLLLLRYAVEECYLATAPQFRYGPSKAVEEPWDWGQPDWAQDRDPVRALARKGSVRYSIDTPYVSDYIAEAYDAVWPLLREDQEIVRRANAMGLAIGSPEEAVLLVEEMLAVLLQVILDRGAGSNLPRESLGALVLLRALDRDDAQDAMNWLYDEGPDTLRVFTTNDFFPDGTPPESTGGYNSIHTNGLFQVEHHLRGIKRQQPEAYPESDYPSLVSDPRTARLIRASHEVTMIGKSYFQFGDGSSAGSGASILGPRDRGSSLLLEADCFHAPLNPETLQRASEMTDDPGVMKIIQSVRDGKHRAIGTTVHDGVGIAVLRTPEAPERAAVGVVYGDTIGHRHRDLLDVQLFAHERPFLTDLGYPQSWTTRPIWEDHWATHNAAWSDLPTAVDRYAGRGRLVRSLFVPGLQLLELRADRWAFDDERQRWVRPGVSFRRLIGLVETDGEAVALVDLSRVRGGITHWRTCRGLEGEFAADALTLEKREGTVAAADGVRGDLSQIDHPDHTALAYMDNIFFAEPSASWTGEWRSSVESSVRLILHQARLSPDTELLTARSTAAMGTPEESGYNYRTLLWKRAPNGPEDESVVDLVFEPRVNEASSSKVTAIASEKPDAAGLSIKTPEGRTVSVYWSPESDADTSITYADGTKIQGPLAAVVDGSLSAVGCASATVGGSTFTVAKPRQTGVIRALARNTRQIDVAGIPDVQPGNRVVVNPEGRGHSYLVENVKTASENIQTLTLDVTSLLGRGRLISSIENELTLQYTILARTGNLIGTRVQSEHHGFWGEIENAYNPGDNRTVIILSPAVGQEERLRSLEAGEWISVVDYIVGDEVLFESSPA